MDPTSLRTYLYCDATEEWHWEWLEDKVVARPPPPAVPTEAVLQAATLAAEVAEEDEPLEQKEAAQEVQALQRQQQQDQGPPSLASDPEIVALAKSDPIVKDLLKDELRFRKTLRDISALETAAASGQQLEETQAVKISRRPAVLADLQIVTDLLEDAKQMFSAYADAPPARTTPTGTRQKQPQSKAKKKAKPVEAVNPLPQQGKAALPISAAVLAAGLASNTATRLAAYAPNSTMPTKVTPSSGLASSCPQVSAGRRGPNDRRGLVTTPSPTISLGGARRQPPAAPAPVARSAREVDTFPRPAVPPIPAAFADDEAASHGAGGFQQVKRKGKAKK